MPVIIEWANNKQNAIINRTEGRWTWDEYHDGVQKTNDMMKTVTHTVHLINIHNAKASAPPGNPISNIKRSMDNLPRNHGLIINVGFGVLGDTMTGIFQSAFPHLADVLVMADTLDEAMKLIASYNPDIPD